MPFKISNSEIEFVECANPGVLEIPVELETSLPLKSSKVYRNAYDKFVTWCDERDKEHYSEDALLAYFKEMAKRMNWKSSTIWSQYSMIKSLVSILNGIDIGQYLKLRAYLKKQGEGYIPKKSRVLTKEQFDRFLTEASDEKYLDLKIVLVFGISGSCRCEELVRLTIDDITDLGSLLHITVSDTKAKKTRSFRVVGEELLRIYRKYVSLRPKDMEKRRFFIKYSRKKCCRQVMGINKIGGVSKEVASFLNLPNWNEYTGHCFRNSAAIIRDT